MEYRGYDSWGVAYTGDRNEGAVIRRVGRVAVEAAGDAEARAAIGHTRWATHGDVSERNAHPHLGANGRIALVHNGIIENVDQLRTQVLPACRMRSDTDSELLAHLVERRLRESDDVRSAVASAFALIEGTNACAVLDRATGEIVVAAHRLPIRLGKTRGALVIASDLAALSGTVETAVVVPDDVVVSLGTPDRLGVDALQLLDLAEAVQVPGFARTTRGEPGASMRAEIAEQPDVLRRIAASGDLARHAARLLSRTSRVVFTGCGSAYHAAMFTSELLQEAANGLASTAIPASELLARPALIHSGDTLVAFTQSGETADVIDAIAVARDRDATVIGVVNMEGSTVAGLVDAVVPLCAGPERSVLATKSCLAMIARGRQLVDAVTGSQACRTLEHEACRLETALGCETHRSRIGALADHLSGRQSALVVAGGAHLPVALEAALKIKEGSYLHAEAVRTGELKHGVIALIDDGYPCILLAPEGNQVSRLRIAADELASRGAAVYWMGPGAPAARDHVQHGLLTDSGSPYVQTMLGQMVALETALRRGVDPDFPRNLAKSVTVR